VAWPRARQGNLVDHWYYQTACALTGLNVGEIYRYL
jgi:hypothetical protein